MSGMRNNIKASCGKRLTRIEGQVRGLAKMVEEDRYCIDIVTQIAAVRAALRHLKKKSFVTTCLIVSSTRSTPVTRLTSAGRSKSSWPL
jgi:DNA-binding FrmR family transcriptional regulator